MKKLIVLLLVAALGIGAFVYFGGLDRVTEDRVEAALVENGVPESMAECMAPRMVEKLSLNQLRKLERMAAQDGETAVPLSSVDALARLRRVDDPEAVRTLASAGAGCALQMVIDAN